MQGVFQNMIPHEVLVCGLSHPSSRGLRMEWMGSFPATEERLAELFRADGGVIPAMIPLWERNERQAIVLRGANSSELHGMGHPVLEQVRKLDLQNVVAHGLPGFDG